MSTKTRIKSWSFDRTFYIHIFDYPDSWSSGPFSPAIYTHMQLWLLTLLLTLSDDKASRKQISVKLRTADIFVFSSFRVITRKHAVETKRRNFREFASIINHKSNLQPRPFGKANTMSSEKVIWTCNFAFLQSFLIYSKSSCLENVLTILEFNWNVSEARTHNWKVDIVCSRRPHNCKTGHSTSWKERERDVCEINARGKCAKLLLFTVKYANLWRSCCHRRRGCFSPLIAVMDISDTTVADRNKTESQNQKH